MRGEHEPHKKITRGAGAGSDLIQFPRSQIAVESVPPLDIGRDGAPLAEFSREQGGLEWKWKKGGSKGSGGGRRPAGYCTLVCPSSLLARKRDFLPPREALKLENPYSIVGRGPSSPTRARTGWMNHLGEIISHPNFLQISEGKKTTRQPKISSRHLGFRFVVTNQTPLTAATRNQERKQNMAEVAVAVAAG